MYVNVRFLKRWKAHWPSAVNADVRKHPMLPVDTAEKLEKQGICEVLGKKKTVKPKAAPAAVAAPVKKKKVAAVADSD